MDGTISKCSGWMTIASELIACLDVFTFIKLFINLLRHTPKETILSKIENLDFFRVYFKKQKWKTRLIDLFSYFAKMYITLQMHEK